MKVDELLVEARNSFYDPSTQPRATRTARGEKTAIMKGSTEDWLTAMNKQMKNPITSDHIAAVRTDIKQSKEYKALIDLGYVDASSAKVAKGGGFVFKNPKTKEQFNFQPTGKINNRTQYGGGARASTVPRIVPNDPHATLLKTMTRSFAHFTAGEMKKAKSQGEQNTKKQQSFNRR